MKSWITCGSLTVLLLAACGQSGDLYLPDNPPPEVQKREQQEQHQKQKTETP